MRLSLSDLQISGNRQPSVGMLDSGLRYIRALVVGLDHVLMVVGLVALAFINILLNKSLFSKKETRQNNGRARAKPRGKCSLL